MKLEITWGYGKPTALDKALGIGSGITICQSCLCDYRRPCRDKCYESQCSTCGEDAYVVKCSKQEAYNET